MDSNSKYSAKDRTRTDLFEVRLDVRLYHFLCIFVVYQQSVVAFFCLIVIKYAD